MLRISPKKQAGFLNTIVPVECTVNAQLPFDSLLSFHFFSLLLVDFVSCHRCNHQRCHLFFLTPDRYLGRHAGLGRVGHADAGRHPAPAHRLAQQLEGVCGLVDGDVGAIERLQGQRLGQLLRCV